MKLPSITNGIPNTNALLQRTERTNTDRVNWRLQADSTRLRHDITPPRIDSGREQDCTIRSLSAFRPPVFAGEQVEPGHAVVLALAAVREGDTLVVPKLDRLARSVPDARAIADRLRERGVKLALGRALYDPGDPMGKLFFNILRPQEGGSPLLRTPGVPPDPLDRPQVTENTSHPVNVNRR